MWEPAPGSTPKVAPQAAPARSLWKQAPGWRRLIVSATLLTAAAVALPLALRSAPNAVTPLPEPAMSYAGPGSAGAAGTAGVPGAGSSTRTAGAETSQVCQFARAPAPTLSDGGTVVSFEDPATSLARLKRTEARLGASIDPDYRDNPRVEVRIEGGRYNGQYGVFIVPRSIQVHLGDRVRVQNGYRNVNLPCNYVPNLVTADLGPAPEFTGPGEPGASRPPP